MSSGVSGSVAGWVSSLVRPGVLIEVGCNVKPGVLIEVGCTLTMDGCDVRLEGAEDGDGVS